MSQRKQGICEGYRQNVSRSCDLKDDALAEKPWSTQCKRIDEIYHERLDECANWMPARRKHCTFRNEMAWIRREYGGGDECPPSA
mmetsp:Transcript_30247/g.48534  ORF Transcript_30247/g.48534 Transcript_30247/m.48534 type:complete len:85 (+) Transcript_30247:71-325(+)